MGANGGVGTAKGEVSQRGWGGGGGVERMASGGGSVPQSVCPELPPPGSPASGAKSGSANTQLGKADQLHLIRDLRVVAAGCLHGGREDGGGSALTRKLFEG